MSLWKKTGLLAGITAAAVFDVAVYASYHYYYRAAGESILSKKIALLQTSMGIFPYNDLVNYELGKAHFELGLQNLQEPSACKADLEAAVQYLERALALNPTSPYSHLYLGQALLHLGFVSPIEDAVLLARFKKAASLAGEDSQVLNEVGKFFLGRWTELHPEERDFTRGVVRKILDRKDREKAEALLTIWELDIKDYSFMDEVLPSDAQTYRQYAEFLGERSLSLEERTRYLSRAEALDFSRARSILQGEGDLLSRFPSQETSELLALALRLLKGIKFYQALRGEDLFSQAEHAELLGRALLELAKARLDLGAKLSEVEDYLREYLSLETRPTKAEELERYLRRREVLPGEFGQSLEDLDCLAFELWLRYKQAKYRQVVDFGRRLEDSLLVVPQSKKAGYVRVLQVVGDSFDKIDSVYNAGDYFRRALQADPENLETVVRLRRHYDRLNEFAEVGKVDTALKGILAPAQKEFGDFRLRKGERSANSLILDGQAITMELSFAAVGTGAAPLISIFFNDRVAWEGYLTESPVTLSLTTKLGRNRLQIRPVNRDVFFIRMTYRRNPENPIESSSRRLE